LVFVAAAYALHMCLLQGIRDSNHILDEVEDDGLLPAVEEVTTEQLVADKQQVRAVCARVKFPANCVLPMAQGGLRSQRHQHHCTGKPKQIV
jgi:hypothetical protein